MRNVGKQIKEIRMQQNMTQLQLAKIVGINRSHIAKIETGKTRPSLSVLERLADALDVSIVELFKDTGKYEKTVGL